MNDNPHSPFTRTFTHACCPTFRMRSSLRAVGNKGELACDPNYSLQAVSRRTWDRVPANHQKQNWFTIMTGTMVPLGPMITVRVYRAAAHV